MAGRRRRWTNCGGTGFAPAPANATQATETAYVPDAAVVAAKLQTAANLNTTIVYDLATGLTGAAQPASCTAGSETCVPRYMTNFQPQDFQKTGWTCGPESSRLVLDQMIGVLDSESSIASAEGTSSNSGTSIGPIVHFLDHNQSKDTFSISMPSSPTDYMDMVATDAYYGYTNSGGNPGVGHSVINNVDTAYLQYWDSGGRPIQAGHYQITYGYDTRGGGSLNVFDEYNPRAIPANQGGYPNWTNQSIYGTHVVALSQMYAAIRHSGGIVW